MRTRSDWFAVALGALVVVAPNADGQQGQISAAVPRAPSQIPTPAQGYSCIAGRVFGITEYQCTSCGMASPRDSTRVVYSFGTEPVVIETDPTNRIRPGDKVVAVNGNPITTRAGADQFAYPPMGNATITVRRNNVNITFDQLVPTAQYCPVRGFSFSSDSMQRVAAGAMGGRGGAGGGGAGGGGRGGARVGGAVMRSVDGTIIQMDTALAARLQRSADSIRARGGAGGRAVQILRAAPPEPIVPTVQVQTFGFSLTCHPTCTRARTRDGTTQYWRFDNFPTIANSSSTSAAGKAGLRDGDVLLSVNGISPQVEEGALILNRADREQTLRLEVRRDGKTEKITLKL